MEQSGNGSPEDRVLEYVRQWRDELIALGRRNRGLYFKPTKSGTLLIERPSLGELVEQLNSRNGSWSFYEPPDPPPVDPGDEPREPFSPYTVKPVGATEILTQKQDRASLERSLRLLDRKSRQEFIDKGLWVLYLVAGMLEWTDPDDDAHVKTPIVLMPVRLDRASPRDPYRLVLAEGDAFVSPALVARFEADFDLIFPEFGDPEAEDPLAYLEQIDRLVKPRGWGVRLDAVLDAFSFHKEVMYRDLLENEDQIAASSLVQALALGPEARLDFGFDPPDEEDLDEKYPPEETTTILDADASQRRCMAAAQQGHSFVMDGPPGTGKSQTIANLIAQSLVQGNSVLFVSEKIAALEVVKARLDAAGLGEYLLEMHSHKATRKEVAQTLYRSLSTQPRPPKGMGAGETTTLRERRIELSRYADAANELRPLMGRSLHEVVGRITQLQGVQSAPLPEAIDRSFTAASFAEVMELAGSLSRAWGPVTRRDDFLWHGLNREATTEGGKREVRANLGRAADALAHLKTAVGPLAESLELWWDDGPGHSADLLAVAERLVDRPDIPQDWFIEPDFDRISERARDLEHMWTSLEDEIRLLVARLGPDWASIPPSTSADLAEASATLDGLDPAWDPNDLAATELESVSSVVSESVEVLPKLRALAVDIGAGLGIDTSGLTIQRVAELADLADLIGALNPPETRWLDPLTVEQIDLARAVLQKLVEASLQKASELRAIFLPEVVDLDLETLRARFESLHRGPRKLGAAYRADKRLLKAVTRSGKVTKEVLAWLPLAIEWKRLKAELSEAERRHAPSIGDHYYRGEQTDFGEVAGAIGVARSALDLAQGRLLDVDQFRSQISLGGSPDAGVKAEAATLRRLLERWHGQLKEAFGDFAGALTAEPFDALEAWFATLRTPTRILAAVSRQVGELSTQHLSFADVKDLATRRHKVARATGELELHKEEDVGLLGLDYEGRQTNWEQLRHAVEWTSEIRNLLGGSTHATTAERLNTVRLDPDALRSALDTWVEQRDALVSRFATERQETFSADLDANFEESSALLEDMRRSMGDIDEWAAYVDTVSKLSDLGLARVVELMVEVGVSQGQVPDVVERSVLEAWVDRTIAGDRRLKHLRSKDRAALVDEFRQLDRKLVSTMSRRVIDACNARRPRTHIGASGIIEREGQKKRRHMPVRVLLERADEVVQDLKPCFMMSPMSVSQFLSPNISFDLVIFDEASQVKPADAVNCVYRGRQLIIAGDQKQLPPTSFFDRVTMDGDDEYQEEEVDEFESVLDLAKAGGLPSLSLRWHYRSQHESLITYSNYSFYDGRLVTFPGAQQSGSDIGIELVKVPGVYRRGAARDNLIEADKVAERVLLHARDHPHLTMGVVAFSEAQASTVEHVLDRKRREHPELDGYFTDDRLSGFFVKNLENVQGDERDIMIFSIGYGPDEAGKITMGFGPLNAQGGERRLNVAITRAKRRVEIVTSILPNDFTETASVGPRHLRRYLDFAINGMSVLAIDIDAGAGDVESPFEAEVLRVVRRWGFDVVPQLGVADYRIDLAVADPDGTDRYVLGVECDGAMYHSSRVARDRDRLRQEVLERLGWRMYRIWGPAWYRDRTGEEKRLREAIERAIESRNSSPSAVDPPVASSIPRLVEVDLDALPPWAEPYQVTRPIVNAQRDFLELGTQRAIVDAIEQVVDTEAPIHRELLLRRVREAWHLGRAGSRIRQAFDSALAKSRRSGHITVDRRGFVWRTNQTLQSVRTPNDGPDSRRTVGEVPREELSLALVNLVEDARRVEQDELSISVARLFGWARQGNEIAEALRAALRNLIKTKKISVEGTWLAPGHGG